MTVSDHWMKEWSLGQKGLHPSLKKAVWRRRSPIAPLGSATEDTAQNISYYVINCRQRSNTCGKKRITRDHYILRISPPLGFCLLQSIKAPNRNAETTLFRRRQSVIFQEHTFMEVQSCDMRLRLCFLAIHRIHPEWQGVRVEVGLVKFPAGQPVLQRGGNNPVTVWGEKSLWLFLL